MAIGKDADSKLNLDNLIRRVIVMTVREDILRQVLKSRGLDVEEVLAEARRRQDIIGLLTEVGKRVARIVGEFGLVRIDIKVEDGKVTVWWDDGTLTETASLALTQNDDDAKDATEGKRRKDAKGPEVVAKLEAAVKKFGLELKEWQKKSIAFHFPQIVKSLVKETNNGILYDPDFRDAVKMYAEWHPERKAELPQLPQLTQNAENAVNAENASA
jgi:hypothetical protein